MPSVFDVSGKLDMREFQAAFTEYARVYPKDLEYCTNRQALNLAIKAGQRTPLADRSRIKALADKDWWPKFVAKKIMSGGVRIPDGKTAGGRKKSRKVQGHYTRAEAKKVSKKLIANRLKRVGMIRAGWLPAIKILAALKLKARGASLQGTSQIRKPRGTAKAAQAGIKPVAMIANDALGAEKVAVGPLQEALGAAAVDMRQFIKEQFGETAKRFNPKHR